MTYTEATEYIERVPSFTKKNTLENTRELLRRLGSPQESYQIIHVAGTNGKGSVCAFAYHALRQLGRTGLFTSPHLVSIRERFAVDGEQISEQEFVRVFETVMEAVRQMERDGFRHPAYFELLLAMGFTWFARKDIRVLVLEAGLGGLTDATNVVERPAVCVITSISLDHTEYLGDTVEKIAAQKAGIIKEGVPVVYDAGNRTAAQVIEAQARRKGSKAVPCYSAMAEVIRRSEKDIAFVLNNKYYDNIPVTVPFPADYQVDNCLLAMTALRVMDPHYRLTDRQIARGVAQAAWRGRMEMVLPGVIVDGAHNVGGIEAFLEAVDRLAFDGPVYLLFAAVMEKDYEEMIRRIGERDRFRGIVVTQIDGNRRVEAGTFADLFRRYTCAPVYVREEIGEALRFALGLKKEEGLLVCAGSLYLAGEVEKAAAVLGDRDKGACHDQL